jgi:sialate O-acetylesterase
MLFLALNAAAEVTLPVLLSDGAVLQRDMPIHFWGTAAPGENVTITLRGHSSNTVADDLGRWHLYLPPMAAGGPFEATVQGANAIVLHDVMIGEVWIASGQSNMEFPMRQLKEAEREIAAANHADIRLLKVERTHSEYPLSNAEAKPWAHCSPESVRDFSAVAYYFAREIAEKEHVAVGVIESSWGGTVAEAWTSLDALSADPGLMPVFAVRARMMDGQEETAARYKLETAQADAAKANGLPPPPVKWHPEPEMWKPAALYNAMISPLTPYAIRGVVWYQGESNSILDRDPYLYGRQFRALIEDWRRHWGEGDFPFLYVQISNFKSTAAENWPIIRQAQLETLALRNTGMAVTIDIGNPDDVHPLDKLDVGYRLALIARANVYGDQAEYSGPLVREITREPSGLRVWFSHAAEGLIFKGTALADFEVAGADGRFQPAEGRIEGATVVVTSMAVPKPISVRYGWANSPECNLFNREELPASPFTASLPPLH